MLTKVQRRDLVEKWYQIGKNSIHSKYKRLVSSYSSTGVGYGDKEDKVVNVTFPCSPRNIHTFSFYKGDIFFHNHDIKELKALAVMDKLNTPDLSSSNACGCVKFMRFIMDKENISSVGYGFFHSQAIRDLFSYINAVNTARKTYNESFPQPTPAKEAIENKFKAMALKVFTDKVTYRQPTVKIWSHTYGGEYVESKVPLDIRINVKPKAAITGWLKEDDSKKSDEPDKAIVEVTLPLTYYSQLLNKGLAVVAGNIILEKLFDFNNGSFMGLVGAQTYGYKIVAEHAIIHPERNHISFITEEKAREIILLGKTPRSRRTKKELGK